MKLMLIRGLPGSGKSTLAKSLTPHYMHRETDMFWGPDYKFDYSRLTEAHEWCLDQTRNIMQLGFFPVVSNTFTLKRNMRPYFELAREFGIVPTVIHCQNDFGNIHNVPKDALDRMRNQFEYDISDLFETIQTYNQMDLDN
jgi:predicted kinase